jgi:flagellar basal-body rod protein FlgB
MGAPRSRRPSRHPRPLSTFSAYSYPGTGNFFPSGRLSPSKTLDFRGFNVMALALLKGVGKLYMVEALFNQTGYLAAKKTLDAVALRQEAIASNIANLETPGYKRLDISTSFQSELQKACASGDSSQLTSLTPRLEVDANAMANSKDGNSVNLENEMTQLNQNAVLHSFETQVISGKIALLRLAITGKNT